MLRVAIGPGPGPRRHRDRGEFSGRRETARVSSSPSLAASRVSDTVFVWDPRPYPPSLVHAADGPGVAAAVDQ